MTDQGGDDFTSACEDVALQMPTYEWTFRAVINERRVFGDEFSCLEIGMRQLDWCLINLGTQICPTLPSR
jgi:hypothetical protein